MGREGGRGRSDIDGTNHRGSTGEDRDEICSILNPPAQPSAFRMVPRLLDMGRSWGRNRGPDSRVWGYFNVLTTSTNKECALMSGGQHSRSEDLVEVAPVPWKGCPGKTVHGTAEALRVAWPGLSPHLPLIAE